MKIIFWHVWSGMKKNLAGSGKMLVDTFRVCYNSGYDWYSFGIGIGRYIGIGQYIGFADMENVLSVSLSADTDFYIGFLPIW